MPPDAGAVPAETPLSLAFHRCIDGLVYGYALAGIRQGRPCWRRTDRPLILSWTEQAGWVVSDEAGTILSRPWDVEKAAQGALPPEGIWVSRKGDKSYVYVLHHGRAG